jgi:hypothetical protein
MELAERGQLPFSTFNFNVETKRISKFESDYMRAYIINGHVRFKRYTLIDRIKYVFAQFFLGVRK